MPAPWSLASSRKRGKSPLPTSPAPSQEKITNCGGVSPGSSGTGLSGWWGCLPVSAVEPSPISLASAFLPAASPPLSPLPLFAPWPPPALPQPARPAAAAAPRPSPSMPLRLKFRPFSLMNPSVPIASHRRLVVRRPKCVTAVGQGVRCRVKPGWFPTARTNLRKPYEMGSAGRGVGGWGSRERYGAGGGPRGPAGRGRTSRAGGAGADLAGRASAPGPGLAVVPGLGGPGCGVRAWVARAVVAGPGWPGPGWSRPGPGWRSGPGPGDPCRTGPGGPPGPGRSAPGPGWSAPGPPRQAPKAFDFPLTGLAPASRCAGTRSRAGSL